MNKTLFKICKCNLLHIGCYVNATMLGAGCSWQTGFPGAQANDSQD